MKVGMLVIRNRNQVDDTSGGQLAKTLSFTILPIFYVNVEPSLTFSSSKRLPSESKILTIRYGP